MATQSRDTKEIERRVLGALCMGPLSLDDRSEALRSLANYNWILPDHRVIYEVFAALAAAELSRIARDTSSLKSRASAFPISTSNHFSIPAI